MAGLWQTIEQILSNDFSGLDGVSVTVIFFVLLVTTFFTEDGACIAAGALVSAGRVSFAVAVGACFAGIFIGDVGLYLVGRAFGDPISRSRLFRRFISKRSQKKASDWLERRGVAAIFISRFVSGLRLPTYFAAGFLKTNFFKFVFFFIIAALIWTPLLVGSSAFALSLISPSYLFIAIVVLYVVMHSGLTLINPKKRRHLVGRLRRWSNWEFWPLWIFYFPVVIRIALLGLKHRSLTVFTAANPALPAGGFIGESKDDIYRALAEDDENKEFLLNHILLKHDPDADNRREAALDWIEENELGFPVVVKPDSGERGIGVVIAKDVIELEKALEHHEDQDLLIQEFVDGPEISAFYYRFPSRKRGRLFSITAKEFPKLKGDGESTLEDLILNDHRAVCLAQKYFSHNEAILDEIPRDGEEVQIVDVGSHSLGTIFLDGADDFLTEELTMALDRIVKRYDGFYFGRFDLRAAGLEELRTGSKFKIIELNGVTSESTNIYDQKYSLFDAYSILFDQWRIAFEIGVENKKNGAETTGLVGLLKLWWHSGF